MSVDRLASKINVDLIDAKNNLFKSQIFSDILALLKLKII